MEKQQSHSGLVLQYDKRRFDGGPEVEQIRQIEAQQAVLKAQQANQWHYATPLELPEAETTEAPPEVVRTNAPVQAVPVERPSGKVREALLMGPLSLGIGAVGILTAVLAIAVAQRMNNPVLLDQGRTVLKECGRTIRKGALDTLCIPLRLLSTVRTKG